MSAAVSIDPDLSSALGLSFAVQLIPDFDGLCACRQPHVVNHMSSTISNPGSKPYAVPNCRAPTYPSGLSLPRHTCARTTVLSGYLQPPLSPLPHLITSAVETLPPRLAPSTTQAPLPCRRYPERTVGLVLHTPHDPRPPELDPSRQPRAHNAFMPPPSMTHPHPHPITYPHP